MQADLLKEIESRIKRLTELRDDQLLTFATRRDEAARDTALACNACVWELYQLRNWIEEHATKHD